MDKRGGGEGGVIKNFCKKFSSHTSEKFRRGTLLCFRRFVVSKKLGMKKGLSQLSVKIVMSLSTETVRR